MVMELSRVVLALGLVAIVLARDVPFTASNRQAGCSGEGQRCELSSQPCCSNLECRLRPNPDEEYVDETEGECIRDAGAPIPCLAEGKRCYDVGASCCQSLKCTPVYNPDEEYVTDDRSYCKRG